MTDLELFAIKFNLQYFKKRGIIPDSNNVRKLRSKFGTTNEVARYLEHRLQQLEEDEEP